MVTAQSQGKSFRRLLGKSVFVFLDFRKVLVSLAHKSSMTPNRYYAAILRSISNLQQLDLLILLRRRFAKGLRLFAAPFDDVFVQHRVV